VLAPVFERGGELHVAFIERSNEMPVHGGQVAFPGGVCRPEDGSALATALREAEEEVGLRPSDVTIVAALPEVRTMTSGFVITPFVGRIRADYPFLANPREVARIFHAPLSALRDPNARRPIVRTLSDGTEREVPAFFFGTWVIWGATEAIAREILNTTLTLTHSA
jgi:8-oxo-dGTP pyrophosphatase MutT (NUDIX family)